MRAEDLQIGDWVQNPLGLVGRVQSIRYMPKDHGDEYGDYYLVTLAFGESDQTFNINDAQPIPLTPEILEKNGFKRIEGNRLYPNPRWFFAQDGSRDGVVIEIKFYEQSVNGVNILTKINTQSSKDGGVNIIHNCDIEYVHHLQHALRLCRIEKEIQI